MRILIIFLPFRLRHFRVISAGDERVLLPRVHLFDLETLAMLKVASKEAMIRRLGSAVGLRTRND
jgi:hypothetical protein